MKTPLETNQPTLWRNHLKGNDKTTLKSKLVTKQMLLLKFIIKTEKKVDKLWLYRGI